MTTLCIDIGIRNLSMCIMNSSYEILLWEVYNVLDTDEFYCQEKCKNGNICGKKCKRKCPNDIFTCEKHFPKEIEKATSNEFKKKNINEYPLQEIAKAFIQRVNDIYNKNEIIFKGLTSIHIELQPALNPKMKLISHILYGKFVEFYKDSPITIKFVRASQKLKAYTGPEIKCELKGKYAQRKWLSIKYCEWILENKFCQEQKDKWLPIFKSHSKADDLSDTFLYAMNAISGVPKKSKTN